MKGEIEVLSLSFVFFLFSFFSCFTLSSGLVLIPLSLEGAHGGGLLYNFPLYGKIITPRHQRINICKFEEQKMPQPMLKIKKTGGD